MDSRGDWGRTSVRQRSGLKLYAKLIGNGTLPKNLEYLVLFSEKCINLVDRVAIKSMDSKEDWGRISVRQRSGHKLYGNWLEMLPCPRIWNIWCFLYKNVCFWSTGWPPNRWILEGIGDGLRCDSDLVRNCVQIWLEMLPCPRIWNSRCDFFEILYRPGGHQIDGF